MKRKGVILSELLSLLLFTNNFKNGAAEEDFFFRQYDGSSYETDTDFDIQPNYEHIYGSDGAIRFDFSDSDDDFSPLKYDTEIHRSLLADILSDGETDYLGNIFYDDHHHHDHNHKHHDHHHNKHHQHDHHHKHHHHDHHPKHDDHHHKHHVNHHEHHDHHHHGHHHEHHHHGHHPKHDDHHHKHHDHHHEHHDHHHDHHKRHDHHHEHHDHHHEHH